MGVALLACCAVYFPAGVAPLLGASVGRRDVHDPRSPLRVVGPVGDEGEDLGDGGSDDDHVLSVWQPGLLVSDASQANAP